ncbi:MAG: hypothetical protein OET44_02020 [Gammaproteobacteria bacterium]|nr:hypothetical protein [Gammaproteobacteria bacterium]
MRPSGYSTDAFTDLLFNALLGFTLLFFITILFMNPIAKLGNATLKAEFIISVIWPEHRPDDVDVWVEDPNGQIVSYLRKDAGWLHLDRDDQGVVNDTIVIDGREVIHPINQELVTIRGIVGGEYVVNLYNYANRSREPVPVTVRIEKVNPSLTTVFVDRVVLERENDELTVVRFTLAGDGALVRMNRLPKTLTPYALEGG